MTDTIIKSFDTWTEAQGIKSKGRVKSIDNISLEGITRLRELILDLAIRGRLVPQNPHDEPASELLKKIEKEKAKLVKERKLKKEKPQPEINDEEKPFELPMGWEWVRIGNICHDWGQKTPTEDFTYIEVSAIDNSIGKLISPTILKAVEAPSRARKIVKYGTVIYSTVRPYLKNICVIDENYNPEPIASTAFAIVHPYMEMPGKYFLNYFQSPVFVDYVESIQIGIAYPAINDKQFFGGVIPLPPLPEQHRIVAKVEELMALCDKLEAEQTTNLKTHQQLVKTLLQSLTAANDAEELGAAWRRLSAHFDTLFCTEDSIIQLKQTILQLAIMGRLVPQCPNDEPASELLKKIEKEKAKLVKDGKLKKEKPLPSITENEKPFDLPAGWVWVRLGEFGIVFSGASFKSEDFNAKEGTRVIKITNAGVGDFIETNDYLPVSFMFEYEQYLVEEDDLVLALTRPYIAAGLKISRCPPSYNKSLLNQRVASIRLLEGKIFVFHYLRSSMILNLFIQRFGSSGLQPNLKVSDVTNLVLPIPPLAEQHRIVAKVEELMALCDKLSASINKAQEIKVSLSKTVVERAVG